MSFNGQEGGFFSSAMIVFGSIGYSVVFQNEYIYIFVHSELFPVSYLLQFIVSSGFTCVQ